MRFADRVALITAAASGIGRATAGIIAAEGGRVAAIDIDEDRLEQLADEVTAAGGRIGTVACNALDRQAVRAAVAEVVGAHGRIDILVNAVGGSTIIADPAATVDVLRLEEWQSITAFNLESMFLFTREVVPVMKRQGSGKIVNLASIAGRGLSDSSSSAYAAAKGGVIAFTHKTARELGPFRHHSQRGRPQHHPDRADPAAVGAAQPGGSRRRCRVDPPAPGRRGGRPGQGDLLPGVGGRPTT